MMLFQRRLFFELMGNALTALLLLLAVLVFITAVQIVSSVDGLSLWTFVKTIPIFMGVTANIVVPVSVLVAVVLTYGRAAADNEVDTLRACGVHPFHLVTPGLVFGALMSALLLVALDDGQPHAERAKRRLTRNVDFSSVLAQKLASGEPEFLDENILISTESFDETGLAHGMTLLMTWEDGTPRQEIYAETARAFVDPDRSQVVIQLGKYRTVFGDRADGVGLKFYRKLGKEFVDLDMGSMTTAQLTAWLQRPEGERGMFKTKAVRTEVALRAASAAGCFVFVLLGIPVALRFRRSDRVGAFLVAFLLALFLYYPSVRVGKALALSGTLVPEVAVFCGHVLLLVAALIFALRSRS